MGSVNGPIDGEVCDQIDLNFRTERENPEPDPDHPCRPQVV